MKTSVVRAWGLFASVVVAGVAAAQSGQAVEWKVSEGGNGHWYRIEPTARLWTGAREAAEAIRGHLLTVGSESEALFVRTCGFANEAIWIGLYQDHADPNYSEPAGGWKWITGEPLAYTKWRVNTNGQPNEPNNGLGYGDEDFGLMDGDRITWNDGGFGPLPSCVEWDADCNADGIVDYGQILRGELEDLNSNGVPDICETSISSVLPPSVPAQGGSAITIRGNGFPANPTVLIGGVPATNVVRESLTRITATSPAVLPGMASVSVNDFTLADGIYIRPECGSDLDQNGVVDGGDMSILLLDWGQCYATVTSPQAGDATPFMLQEEPAVAAPRSR